MKILISISIAILVLIFTESSIGKPKNGKQLSFAIPALNLLNGGNNNNNNNNNNNIFGARTTTRTIIRTVATITVPAFRTCTTTMAAAMFTPCAGRRRREVEVEANGGNYAPVEASPVIILKFGNTQISDPVEVANFLEEHRPLPSVIGYPNADVPTVEDSTTAIYSSRDVYQEEQNDEINTDSDFPYSTTETPYSSYINDEINNDETTPQAQDDLNDLEKARINFGQVSTVTTTISVTSVATTFATGGAAATLQVIYAGCSPPVLPVSGLAC